MSEAAALPVVETPPATEANVAPALADTPSQDTEKVEAVAQKTYTEDEVKALKDAEGAKIRSKYERKLERQRIEAETRQKVQQEQAAQKTELPTNNEPTREQFENYEDYIEARATYRAELKAAELVDKKLNEKEQTERSAREAVQNRTISEHWTKREAAFTESADDYEDLVVPFVQEEMQQIDLTTRRAIVESDLGPNILYYLAKNPDEFERIADLSPLRQIAEIGKLEDKVAKPPAKKASNAPDPIKPVGTKASVEVSPENMTDKQFAEWRRSQIRARNSH
jgi:hypothetical protein